MADSLPPDLSSDGADYSLVNIEDELKQSYMAYAMTVIVGRALPDVRDGLKPGSQKVFICYERTE